MDWSWLWSRGGGGSIFDPYSLYHIVFFLALTITFYPLFEQHVWLVAIAIAFSWEVCEYWINVNLPWFPYVGSESLWNKCIGDPISNLIGFLFAMYLIKKIRKMERQKIIELIKD
jgi:hypothetical protein